MFSTVLAYFGFIVTSLCFLVLIMDGIFNYSHNQKVRRIYKRAGKTAPNYFNIKMATVLVIWIATGIFIWG